MALKRILDREILDKEMFKLNSNTQTSLYPKLKTMVITKDEIYTWLEQIADC